MIGGKNGPIAEMDFGGLGLMWFGSVVCEIKWKTLQ
jgi:hypothetical protein